MIKEEYIEEVAMLLQGSLERVRQEGTRLEYWLDNSTAFAFLENKEIFIYKMLQQIYFIEGLRVEKSPFAKGFVMKTRLGQFFYLDIENKEYYANEDFLDQEFWDNKCIEIEKEIEGKRKDLEKLEAFFTMNIWQRFQSGLLNPRKREEKRDEIKRKICGLEKRYLNYRKKKEIFEEVYKVVVRLIELMDKNNYKIRYC